MIVCGELKHSDDLIVPANRRNAACIVAALTVEPRKLDIAASKKLTVGLRAGNQIIVFAIWSTLCFLQLLCLAITRLALPSRPSRRQRDPYRSGR